MLVVALLQVRVAVTAAAVTVRVRDAVEDEAEHDVEEHGAAGDHHHGDRLHLEW